MMDHAAFEMPRYNVCAVVIFVAMTSRHIVVRSHGIMSQRRDVTHPLLIVLKLTSDNEFARKIIRK
jgi:hypothetical protein